MDCSNLDSICNCGRCDNELNLKKLCVKKIRSCKICTNDLSVNNEFCAKSLSSPSLCTSQLMANKADVNNACVSNLNSSNNCFQNVTATNMGVSNLVANDLCVPGTLQAANFVNFSKYRATAVYSAVTTYNLGDPLNFSTILDDPNGNMSSGPSKYVVPISGYYMVMIQVDEQNLVPTPAFGPILGVPVANPQLYVNGVVDRQLYSAYLTFFNQQRATLTALMSLKKGDVVTSKFDVLALNQSSGISQISGTVDILGSGAEQNQSVFKIILLSAENPNGTGVTCQPSIPCAPCLPLQCVPCDPSRDCSSEMSPGMCSPNNMFSSRCSR